ncbi:MAG: NYN domain-containing protein [Candidatus Heimdallarchaeota archaeon]|nr:NYN domain-containing protein [Candidatus Heimdallarchaeota archaeon]MDH5646824.1 NYN domain-containing protein [Candidatus Heimdallarchaeota archaeon]
MSITGKTVLFWDYENIPLLSKDQDAFLNKLKELQNIFNIIHFRIFARSKTLSYQKRKFLRSKGFSTRIYVHWVDDNSKNAVDNAIKNDCMDVVGKENDISHIILISGDGDYYSLLEKLPHLHITIIHRNENINERLYHLSNFTVSIKKLISKEINSLFH